jgi:endonuclease YncB( thermonuclease family)
LKFFKAIRPIGFKCCVAACARVIAILSGDTIVVDLGPTASETRRRAVSLVYLVAHRFGTFDGKFPDDEHGFDSWNWMRTLCIGKYVFINDVKPLKDTFRHVLGVHDKFPVYTSPIGLDVDGSPPLDLGLEGAQRGFLKMRSSVKSVPLADREYHTQIQREIETARSRRLGIWAPNGRVRHLPVPFVADDLLKQRIFTAIVESIVGATKYRVSLLPDHIFIQIQIAGTKSCGNSSNCDGEAKDWALSSLLHRKFQIKLVAHVRENKFAALVLGKDDGAIQFAIARGYAQFVRWNVESVPHADLYAHAEWEARHKRVGMWQSQHFSPTPPRVVTGICNRTQNACGVRIANLADHFYSLDIPFFFSPADREPWAFEARELLLLCLVGQEITAEVVSGVPERDYAIISFGSSCVNTHLLKRGLAKLRDPFLGGLPEDRLRSFQRHSGLRNPEKWAFGQILNRLL